MIKVETIEVSGFEGAIKSMRNPYNSWDKSDSGKCGCMLCEDCAKNGFVGAIDPDEFAIGIKDMELCKKLIKAGSDHMKFIHVQADVTAPLYFWEQFVTSKVEVATLSCSIMNAIESREFTADDFSINFEGDEYFGKTIGMLNELRSSYVKTKTPIYWDEIIKLLPSSYNQLRTIDLSYETLIRMYHARKNHKLEEWHSFCDWIETLPYMKEFLNA